MGVFGSKQGQHFGLIQTSVIQYSESQLLGHRKLFHLTKVLFFHKGIAHMGYIRIEMQAFKLNGKNKIVSENLIWS